MQVDTSLLWTKSTMAEGEGRRMRNIRLDIEYNGAAYNGWQTQPDAPSLETTIKQAVERMVNHEIILYSSGRTDAGVHAEQHVAHFFSETELPHYKLRRGLNSLTPRDIVIYRVDDMPLDWSARHSAIEREYRYRIYNDESPSVFWQDISYWTRERIDVKAMIAAAPALIGRHDFTSFRSLHCEADSPVRTIRALEWSVDGPLLSLRVTGDAFLRHQVRIITGTLVDVGCGRLKPEEMKSILEARDRSRAGRTLPGCGLTLVAVRYPGDDEPRRRPMLGGAANDAH